MWADIRILAEASWSLTRKFKKSLSLSLSPLSLSLSCRDSAVVEGAAAALMANSDFDPAGFNESMAAVADAAGLCFCGAPVATNSASHRPDIACSATDPLDLWAYP